MHYRLAVILLVLFLADKAVSYYGATLGLLQYLQDQYGKQPDAEKLKELRDAALARRARELLRRD